MMQISDAEYSVMKVLWKIEPCTSAEIVELVSKEEDWNDKTIRTLINRLVEKKAIKADNIGSKAYIYSSLISEKDYKANENTSFLNKLYGGSVNLMIASLIENNKLSAKEIQDLKDILEGNK